MPLLGVTQYANAHGSDWLRTSRPILVFKHSPICGVSARALDEVTALAAAHPELAVVTIDVIAQRDVSRRITAELDVGHASPQAIIVCHGRPVWNDSHFAIKREVLEREVRRAGAACAAGPGGAVSAMA